MKIPRLKNSEKNFFQILSKVLGGLSLLAVFIAGLYQFRVEKERDFKKEFYKQQIDFLESLVLNVSSIATYYLLDSLDSPALEKEKFNFLTNYSGKYQMYLYDDSLDSYINRFHLVLEKDPEQYEGDAETELRLYANKIAARSNHLLEDLLKIKKNEK